jgi:hypothetical protein
MSTRAAALLVHEAAAKLLEAIVRIETHPNDVPRGQLCALLRSAKPDHRVASRRLDDARQVALRVWKTATAADEFLSRPHLLLRGQTSAAVARRSAAEAKRVIDILGRLEHGTAP